MVANLFNERLQISEHFLNMNMSLQSAQMLGSAQNLFRQISFRSSSRRHHIIWEKNTSSARLSHIDAGIEIVPVKHFADQMSTGVSYFEQFILDLEHRGVADIDVPVLIVGIDA